MVNFNYAIDLLKSNAKLKRTLVEEVDTVILASDGGGGLLGLHSPKTIRWTRSRQTEKTFCLIGTGLSSNIDKLKIKTTIYAFD